MIAVIYIRVSSTGQLDGDGPERQRVSSLKYADANGYTIANTFTEDLSGTKDAKSRAVFLEMLAYCAEHGIQHVIIEKTDRIARDMFVGLQIIGDCAKLGIHLIDADTGRDISHPTGPYEKFVVQILMAAAELNKNVAVHHMNAGKRRIQATGQKCGGRRGYRDENPELVNRIRELRRKRLKWRDIADTLNSESVPTLSGKPWTFQTVHGVLYKKRQTV